jgi:Fuc2NAc and GlcNAc transferase
LILASLAVAFATTLLTLPAARVVARRFHVLDHPSERSSHVTPTPRAGGVAILLGMALALGLGPLHLLGAGGVAFAAGGVLLALVGMLDDRFGLSPWPRLACQALAAAAVVAACGGFDRLPLPSPLDVAVGPLGAGLAVLWIVAVVNFFNFMDGIDGLAGLQGLVTAGTLALALAPVEPAAAAVAAALAGGCAAFLLFNWSPASVFLGDAGSGLAGYTLAVAPFLAGDTGRDGGVLLAGTSLVVFLLDASSCLLRRMLRGSRLYEAHREHLYQRWVFTGVRHAAVAAWLGLAAAVASAAALAGWQTGNAAWSWAGLGIGGAAVAAEWACVRRREQRSKVQGDRDGARSEASSG